jgi:glycosyltransferase involved in cell wall biosynthesis
LFHQEAGDTVSDIPVLVGTYRGRKHIGCCLTSLAEFVTGYSEVIFIDDSGDRDHRRWLSSMGRVVPVEEPGGLARALVTACAAAAGRDCFWLEEDFEFVAPVDLGEMQQVLRERPYLAQVALLRPPVYDYEIRAGSLIGGFEDLGIRCEMNNTIWEQNGCFTLNPSLWPGWVWAEGWPIVEQSDYRRRDALRARGYRFGYLPGIRVVHHGEHEGHGY